MKHSSDFASFRFTLRIKGVVGIAPEDVGCFHAVNSVFGIGADFAVVSKFGFVGFRQVNLHHFGKALHKCGHLFTGYRFVRSEFLFGNAFGDVVFHGPFHMRGIVSAAFHIAKLSFVSGIGLRAVFNLSLIHI